MTGAPLLEVRDLTVDFALPRPMLGRRRTLRAVDRVSFDIGEGETLGLVGESGSGKTTIGRAILDLLRPTAGTIAFAGVELGRASADERRRMRPQVQVVFQNPYASLNPALTIGDAIGEPLRVHRGLTGSARDDAVAELLRRVGLDPGLGSRYPQSFSGGQRQRIAIARAIALEPRLLIADEAVSALDVSTRGQIINLLDDLTDELGLACLFIGHDLAVVRHASDRIAVLYRGELVEIGPADEVADRPRHPYTQNLVAAVPVPDPVVQADRRATRRMPAVTGPVAGAVSGRGLGVADVAGCVFAARCPHRMDRCLTETPAPRRIARGRVRCHLYPDEPDRAGARLPVEVVPSAEAAGDLVAERILDGIEALADGQQFRLACPAGRTPITTCASLGRLAAERGSDLSRLVVLMVDEYVDEGPDGYVACYRTAHYSCTRFFDEHVIAAVNAHLTPARQLRREHVRGPDPADPAATDAELAAAGEVDLFLLAAGATDGHVAFNPPGTRRDAGTRVVALAESTRRDNLATFPGFAGLHEVPSFGVTVGLRSIARAHQVVLVLLGEGKADAFDRLLRSDGFDPAWPASIVYECADVLVVVDEAAAGTDRSAARAAGPPRWAGSQGRSAGAAAPGVAPTAT